MAKRKRQRPQTTPQAVPPSRGVGYPAHSASIVARKQIPVEVTIPEDQFTDYADAFTINHSTEEFVISFLQLQYPIAITQAELDKLKSVESICVARIALTPKRLQLLIEALQTNLQAYIQENLPKEEEK